MWVLHPRLIMAAVGLLNEIPDPTEEEARFAIGGNLCRCTGYSKVVQAIMAAAEVIRDGKDATGAAKPTGR